MKIKLPKNTYEKISIIMNFIVLCVVTNSIVREYAWYKLAIVFLNVFILILNLIYIESRKN